jgi:hypothetical protein
VRAIDGAFGTGDRSARPGRPTSPRSHASGEREAVDNGRRLQAARRIAYGHLAVSSARPGSLSLSRFGFRDSLACSPRRGHNQPADCQDAARHASFEVSLRSSAMVVCLDPVGVLGARPAVLAHERAVDRRVHEHQGGGHSAFGGEIRSHALPSRLRSDSACAAAATGSTSAACPRPDRPRRIRRPEADSYSALSRCWRPGAGCSSRP